MQVFNKLRQVVCICRASESGCRWKIPAPETPFAGESKPFSDERGPFPGYRASSIITRCPSFVASIFCTENDERGKTKHIKTNNGEESKE